MNQNDIQITPVQNYLVQRTLARMCETRGMTHEMEVLDAQANLCLISMTDVEVRAVASRCVNPRHQTEQEYYDELQSLIGVLKSNRDWTKLIAED